MVMMLDIWKRVLKAVNNVNTVIKDALLEKKLIKEIDDLLIKLMVQVIRVS